MVNYYGHYVSFQAPTPEPEPEPEDTRDPLKDLLGVDDMDDKEEMDKELEKQMEERRKKVIFGQSRSVSE